MTTHPWTVPVRVDRIPDAGWRLELAPDEPTRAALARAAGVDGVPRLHATFDLVRHGRDGVHVTGSVSATVRQTCVVTLEPMSSEIEEAVDLVFAPGQPAADGDHAPPALDAGEPPEPLVGAAVDLAAVTVEFLILGIDPHPRKPGAIFEAPASADAGAKPFAALAALKQGKAGKS